MSAAESSAQNVVFAVTVPRLIPMKTSVWIAPVPQAYIAPTVKATSVTHPFVRAVENTVWNVLMHSVKTVICVIVVF